MICGIVKRTFNLYWMSEEEAHVRFGKATVMSDETECGFIPAPILTSLRSDDKDERAKGAQALLNLISSVSVETIDFPGFLVFSQPYFLDEDFGVVNCFNEMIEVLVPKIGPDCVDHLEEFLTLIITPLGDHRRSVRILVVNLMLLYVETSQSLELVSTMLSFFEDQPPITQSEILDFVCQAVERFKPPEELYRPIAAVIKAASKISNIAIQNASSKLVVRMCAIMPSFMKLLQNPSSNGEAHVEEVPKIMTNVKVPSAPLIAKMSRPMAMNPRARNMIFRPKATKPAYSMRTRLPPVQSAEPVVRPPSPEDELHDLRQKYKSESRPTIHPPDMPRPPDAGEMPRSPRGNPRNRRPMARPPPPVPKKKLEEDIEKVSELLQDPNWEIQNETIIELIEMVQEKPDFISKNLRVLTFGLMPSISSARSALAETALTCLREVASEFGEDMTPFFETILSHLLTLLSSTRQAIARLASDCVSVILINVDRNASLEFLSKDHSKRSPEVKEHLALCLDVLSGDCFEPSQLLPTIGMLLLEDNENTQEHATAALAQLVRKFDDLLESPVFKSMDPKAKDAIIEAVKLVPAEPVM